jgi:hypothetical protein
LKRPHNGSNRHRSASLSEDFDHDHADAPPGSARAGCRFIGQAGYGTAAAKAHLATIKRFCICAFTVLAAGGVLAAIVALKATIYLSRLNY